MQFFRWGNKDKANILRRPSRPIRGIGAFLRYRNAFDEVKEMSKDAKRGVYVLLFAVVATVATAALGTVV